MAVKRAGSPAASGAPEGAHDDRRDADQVDETGGAGSGAERAPMRATTGPKTPADTTTDAVVPGAGSSDSDPASASASDPDSASDSDSTDGTSADVSAAGTPVDATPVDTTHADPAHADPAHADPAHADPAHADPAHADPTHADEVPPPPPVQALDPRAIARASLEASRNASLWWTSAGVIVAMVVALVVGTRAGSYTLAAMLAACALVRAVLPHPGPIAISVRAKAIDVTVLTTLAVSIAVLAQLLPGRTI